MPRTTSSTAMIGEQARAQCSPSGHHDAPISVTRSGNGAALRPARMNQLRAEPLPRMRSGAIRVHPLR